MNAVADIVSQVDALPPLPDTALKLMRVINDPRSTVDQIIESIRYDQAVTTEMLKLCNSAFFGRSRQITSLNDAMVTLGTAKLLQLVMNIHANSLLGRAQDGYGLEPGVLWRHSVAVALAAGLFAEKLDLPDAHLAFTAGLLHDVGKVVLNQFVADDFARIVDRVKRDGCSFDEAEHIVLGCSHDEVGALVAEKWKLPEPIVRCIRYHHDPGRLDPPDDLVDAIHLAHTVCLLIGVGLGEDGLFYRADERVMRRHDLRGGTLEGIGAQTLMELRRVEALFDPGNAGTPADANRHDDTE